MKLSLHEFSFVKATAPYFGDWEMDTVYSGQGAKACLLVLSERKTRQEIIVQMPDRTARSTVHALNNLEHIYKEDFSNIFRTITVDNGVEFSDMEGMEASVLHSITVILMHLMSAVQMKISME